MEVLLGIASGRQRARASARSTTTDSAATTCDNYCSKHLQTAQVYTKAHELCVYKWKYCLVLLRAVSGLAHRPEAPRRTRPQQHVTTIAQNTSKLHRYTRKHMNCVCINGSIAWYCFGPSAGSRIGPKHHDGLGRNNM